MNFANTGRSNKTTFLLALAEAQSVKTLDLLALDGWLEREVERVERLDRR